MISACVRLKIAAVWSFRMNPGTRYYVKDSHEGIIPRDEWNAVQQEFERVARYMEAHHITRYGYGGEIRPFSSKIICGECGYVYGRKSHAGREKETYWQCNTRCYQGPKGCRSENVREDVIHRVFIEAWNTVVDQQNTLSKRWDEMEKNGAELEVVRARQMRALVKGGKIAAIIPEMVLTVLESITIKGGGVFNIRFLDGTEFQVRF